MPRITIIGASGVGKTTLARSLAAKLGILAFDSDDYYHEPTDPPYRVQRAPDERRALLERDLAPHESWVLSGGAGTWVPAPRLDYTAVVFLRLPSSSRMERLRAREYASYGRRILEGGDMHADHIDFMSWTAGYDDSTSEGTNTLEAHEAFLARVECPVIRIEEPGTEAELLNRVLERL